MFAGMVSVSPSFFFYVSGLGHSCLNTWFLRTCSIPFLSLNLLIPICGVYASGLGHIFCVKSQNYIATDIVIIEYQLMDMFLCEAFLSGRNRFCPEISILLDIWVEYLLGHAVDE